MLLLSSYMNTALDMQHSTMLQLVGLMTGMMAADLNCLIIRHHKLLSQQAGVLIELHKQNTILDDLEQGI